MLPLQLSFTSSSLCGASSSQDAPGTHLSSSPTAPTAKCLTSTGSKRLLSVAAVRSQRSRLRLNVLESRFFHGCLKQQSHPAAGLENAMRLNQFPLDELLSTNTPTFFIFCICSSSRVESSGHMQPDKHLNSSC